MNEVSLSGCLVLVTSGAADAVPQTCCSFPQLPLVLARAQVTTFNCGEVAAAWGGTSMASGVKQKPDRINEVTRTMGD